MTPAPRIYNPFAHDVALRRGLDITDSSRLFALLSLALLDRRLPVGTRNCGTPSGH